MKSFTHIRIPSKDKVQVASDYDMATMFLPEGTDKTPYEHLEKGPIYRSAATAYIPNNLKNRTNDYSGGLVIYDHENNKRKLYNLNKWLWIQKLSKPNDMTKVLIDYLPKLRKGEYIEIVHWIYGYYFYRI